VPNRLAFADQDFIGVRQQHTAVKAEVHMSAVGYDVAKAVLQRFAGERITDRQTRNLWRWTQWLGVPLPRLGRAAPRLDLRREDRTGRGSSAVGEPGAGPLGVRIEPDATSYFFRYNDSPRKEHHGKEKD